MCDVTQLLTCQRQVKELQAQVIELEKPKPIVPIPQITKWGFQRHYLVQRLKALGIESFPEREGYILNQWHFYTDLEGWGEILWDLAFESDLYKPDIFACDAYGLKANIECRQRYGLNTLLFCIGKIPLGIHGFNLFPYGDENGIEGFLLWEPNEGFEWSGEAFEIGENSYIPIEVMI